VFRKIAFISSFLALLLAAMLSSATQLRVVVVDASGAPL
jgi:hypothetical protein